MTTIIEYQNGNCHVAIDLSDGTKTRTCNGQPRPEFPESVDLKITERCDKGCKFCHESSTPDGSHALVSEVEKLIKGLPPGVEIAVGGGNPLSHPCSGALLQMLSGYGLVANMTMHLDHAMQHTGFVKDVRYRRWLHGLGLSGIAGYASVVKQIVPGLLNNNTVFHYVAGVDSPQDARRLDGDYKLLILGYKRRGRGKAYYNERVDRNLGEWRYFLPAILRKPNLSVSFDNLAIEQLGVEAMVGPEVWTKHYMGDDGLFSMFVDAVRMEFAASSVDEERRPLDGMTVCEAFATLKPETTETERRRDEYQVRLRLRVRRTL